MASTPTTFTPPSTPIITSTMNDHFTDSWCDLQFKSGCSSAGSINHLNHSVNPEVLERLLQEAQKETSNAATPTIFSNQPSTSISVQSSPKSPQTPNMTLRHHGHTHVKAYEFQMQQVNQEAHNCDMIDPSQSFFKIANNFGDDDVEVTTSTLHHNHLNESVALQRMSMNHHVNSSGNNDYLKDVKKNELKSDTDWIWYWSSRPQAQPPKEWNFVHPNSSKSKYSIRKIELMDSKFLSKDTLNKLIMTHMASFILGATLMFLFLRKHLNFKTTSYFM